MTVTTTVPSIRYIYTGTGQYDFPFRAFKEDDIQVWHSDSEGQQYHMNLNVDYSVEVYEGIEGGYVTILPAAPIPVEGYLLIRRILPIDQEIDWVNNDPFDMELHEASQDKLTMILQQQQVVVEEGAVALRWRGEWQPATLYLLGQMARVPAKGDSIYAAAEEHVSAADFDTDLAAGRWLLVFDMEYLTSLVVRAEDAAIQAEAARDAALAAQAAAEVAQAAAEAAQAASEAARDLSQQYRNEAEAFKDQAETAWDGANQAAALAYQWAQNPYGDPVEPSLFSAFHWSVQSSYWSDTPYNTEVPGNPGRYSSLHWADRSNQWAENPEDTPVVPGQFSALHWAAKAEGWAQGLNLPPILPGDALKVLQVAITEDGYVHSDIAAVGDLKSDGSVPMQGGYIPSLDQDIATKIYADGKLASVVPGEGITVDVTDPVNPIVAVDPEAIHPFFAEQSGSGAMTVDVREAPVNHITLTDAVTLTFDGGPVAGKAMTGTVRVINPTGYAFTITNDMEWPDGAEPTPAEWEGTWEFNVYIVPGSTTWIASNRVEY